MHPEDNDPLWASWGEFLLGLVLWLAGPLLLWLLAYLVMAISSRDFMGG